MEPLYPVQLVKKGRSHFYEVQHNGTTHLFPGVTGTLSIINKPALLPWVKKEALLMVEKALIQREGPTTIDRKWIDDLILAAKKRPDQIKDDAADLGTRVHAAIDSIIHGREPEGITDDMKDPVAAFRDWWGKSGIELVMGDTKVASLKYGYGGSLDAVGKCAGDYIILDWKTSNGIYDEYALQVAAYAWAFTETYGIMPRRAIIVRFSKTAPIEFELKELSDIDRSFGAFLAAKSLRDSMEQEHFL